MLTIVVSRTQMMTDEKVEKNVYTCFVKRTRSNDHYNTMG